MYSKQESDGSGSVSIHPTQLGQPVAQRMANTSRLAPGLVVHISDTLGDARRSDLETALANRQGINDVHFNATRPHLLLVDYDPDQINSLEVLHQIQRQNVRAQLVGPI